MFRLQKVAHGKDKVEHRCVNVTGRKRSASQALEHTNTRL